MKSLVWTIVLTLAAPALEAGAAPPSVRLESLPDGAQRVQAAFRVAASSRIAWDVLSDYGRIDEFVDSMRESAVLERREGEALIAQRARGRVFFVSREVNVLLRVRERPGRLDFVDVSGEDFERYEGAWIIDADESGCLVRYELEAKLKGRAGRLAQRAMRKGAAELLEDVRAEILRRANG